MQSHSSDLLIVGGGSAGFAAAHEALRLGAKVCMFNRGLPLGGTCPNVGCVPSKTLIRAAEAYHRAHRTGFRGLRLQAELEDYGALVRQKRALIEDLRRANYEEALPGLRGLHLVPETARFQDAHTLQAGDGTYTGSRILIATGTSPRLPELPGLHPDEILTNESAFELERLPRSLLVLGGGYIALECAQMFSRFGVRVTLLQRSAHVLSDLPAYLGQALTGYLRDEGIAIHTGIHLLRLEKSENRFSVTAEEGGRPACFEAERLMVATGRSPNSRSILPERAGVRLDAEGFVVTDDFMQTSIPGIYAAGDVAGDPQYVYTASYEGELATRNALGGNREKKDYTALPWVIFTDPQLAGVGLDREAAARLGYEAESATLPVARWPRFRVAHETRGFLELLRDRRTDRLLGGRVLAPEGGDLVTELGLAIRHGIKVSELASAFHPYLTLSEGIQRAAQRFEPIDAS